MKTRKLFGVVVAFLLTSTVAFAQQVEVKGVVKGKGETETEILENATVFLKDSLVSTTTNRKGEFTFPQKLKAGDVLVFSYLGYLKKQVTIKSDTSFLNIVLKEDDNTMLGAVQTNKRYNSKRKNK